MKKWIFSMIMICLCVLGVQNVKAATTQEVVDHLKEMDSFQLMTDNSGEVVYENDEIVISYPGLEGETYSYAFPCKDNVVDYKGGKFETYEEANNSIGYAIWGTYLIQSALEVNGFSTEEIQEFDLSEHAGDFEKYGFEAKSEGEGETFVSEDGADTVTTVPFSLKIDFERATISEDSSIQEETIAAANNASEESKGLNTTEWILIIAAAVLVIIVVVVVLVKNRKK